MNGAHNHNVEQKKLDTKEYSLHGSIHRKLRNRQYSSMVSEDRIAVTLGGLVDTQGLR